MAWESLRDAVVSETAENLGQNVQAFNAASNGGIVLSAPGYIGDFVDAVMFGANDVGAVRDRSTGAGTATATQVAQANNTKISVAGRFGPLSWNAQDPAWQGASESGIVQMLSEKTSEYILKFQLNNSIAAAVGAISNANDAVNDVSASAGISYSALNNTMALLGDASMSTACVICNGVSYHKFVGDALGNSKELFDYQGIQVTNFMGKPFVVVDAPSLTVSTTDYNVLVLNPAGITVENQGSPYIGMIEKTGDNITKEYQVDFSFDLGLKMFKYSGTASPTAAELATGTNWTANYSSAKNGPGALLVADQS